MFGGLFGSKKKSLNTGSDQKALTLTDPAALELFGSLPTASGVSVTAHSAPHIPAVLHAVRLISENAGSIPFKLYQDGSKEAAKDHAAYRLVHNRVNGWTAAGELRTELTRDALLHGFGAAHVVRVGGDKPYELHRLAPGTVQRRHRDNGEPFFVVTDEARRQRELSYRDVLYVPAFGDTSPVKLGKEAIGLAMLLERDAAQLFGSGRRPAIILTNENKAIADGDKGASTIANILKSFRRWQSGPKTDPLIMDMGWTPNQQTMTSTDAQFIENRVEQIREIARVFGIPATMLFDLSNGTYANTEQMAASFLQLCLRPWLDRWQNAYATCLLTEDEQDDFYFEAVIDDLMRADTAGRTEAFGKLVAMRAMTPNEVRAAMNLPAIEGGDELANPYTTTGPAAGSNDNPQPDEDAA